jgi:hypothetical protein
VSSAQAVNRLVVYGDICGSGRLGMAAKHQTRAGMYAAFAEAFDAVGVTAGEIHQEDRGDGILAALDPGVPPAPMVGRWVDTLYECLREHNTGHAARLRMRVAMHVGPVAHDGMGLVGRAVDLTCRLCDSPVAKAVADRAGAFDLLYVVSDWLYTHVVREGGRHIEPDHYRSARVGHKETDELAWFHVPRLSEPPLPAPPSVRPGNERTFNPASQPGDRDEHGIPDGRGGPAAEAGETAPAADPFIRYRFQVRGDSQVFHGNVINGGFTGIRKDGGAADGGTNGQEGGK